MLYPLLVERVSLLVAPPVDRAILARAVHRLVRVAICEARLILSLFNIHVALVVSIKGSWSVVLSKSDLPAAEVIRMQRPQQKLRLFCFFLGT